MLYSRLTVALLCGTVLLLVTSCSDPASVGTGIGPDSLSGGEPQVKAFVPSSLDTTHHPSLTGYDVPATVPSDQRREWRFLTGIVDDPVAATIIADGYVDFLGTANRPDGFSDAPVDSLNAELRLDTVYRHGDTTSTLDVRLFALSQTADMQRAPADTSFEAEAQPIGSYSVAAADSQVTLPLPQSWIEEHQSALQDNDTFEETSVNGFKLTTTNESAVLGFSHGTATLRITTRSDTVDFQTEQTFTHVEREGTPSISGDRLLLQDGVGVELAMNWEDNSQLDSLAAENALLNRAEVTVPVDTAFLEPPSGSNFVRPQPAGYRVFASRSSDDAPECGQLGLFVLSESGNTCIFPTNPEWAPSAAYVVPERAFTVFDQWLSDSPPLSTFRVQIANRASSNPSERQTAQRGLPSTIPAVVRTSDPDTDRLPQVKLTVTPL